MKNKYILLELTEAGYHALTSLEEKHPPLVKGEIVSQALQIMEDERNSVPPLRCRFPDREEWRSLYRFMNQLMNFHELIIYEFGCMCDTEQKRENLILDMEAVAEEIGNLKDRVRKLLPIAGEFAYKDEYSIRKFVEIAKSIDSSDPETNAAYQVASRLLETLLTKSGSD